MKKLPGLVIKIGANTKDAIDGLNKVNRAVGQTTSAADKRAAQWAQLGNVFKGVGLAAGAIGGAAVVAGIKSSIDAASDLNESISKSTVVFGDQSGQIQRWADTASSSMLMSKQAALEAAGTYGNLFQAFGVGQAEASKMSQTLVQLAADLASFNNTSVDDAIQAIRSGLSGEAEPLKRYGVALQDTRMRQEALNQGIYDGKGTLDAYQKSMAAYAIIMKDTALAQGDVERTADGYANTMRAVQAAVEDASAKIGGELLESIGKVSQALGGSEGINDNVNQFANGVGGLIGQVGDLAAALGGLNNVKAEQDRQDKYSQDNWRKWISTVPLIGVQLAWLSGLAEENARAEGELNDELDRALVMRRQLATLGKGTTAQLRDEAEYANKAAEAVNKLNGALERKNGGNRSLIAANIRLRELRTGGVGAYAGTDKKLSMDERRQFGLDYASVVSDKYNALVGAGRLKKAQRLLAGARGYLGENVGEGFARRVLGTPAELPGAIAAKESARAEAGANRWRNSFSSVFGGQVTININANTPAEAVEKAKQWARLGATGRGPIPAVDNYVNPRDRYPNNGNGLIR